MFGNEQCKKMPLKPRLSDPEKLNSYCLEKGGRGLPESYLTATCECHQCHLQLVHTA